MARQDSLFKRSTLFSPASLRALVEGSGDTVRAFASQLSSSNIDVTGSFKYDSPNAPYIKSTQQIPLDWSRFENHTFFNSAESKVNVAFEKIINDFPFDGDQREFESYFDTLTGFEKYVYDKFPKFLGFLQFSGTSISEYPGATDPYAAGLGTHIIVNDVAGALLPTLSKKKGGEVIIGPPKGKTISFEMSLFVPPAANDTQVIVQKLSNEQNGLTIGLEENTSTTTCQLAMIVSSGTNASNIPVISASMALDKGRFNYVNLTLDRSPGQHIIKLYQSGVLKASSSISYDFGKFGFYPSNLLIGSGVRHQSGSVMMGTTAATYFDPVQTFSGAIDELRVFHNFRFPSIQKEFQLKNVFSTPDLKLYYKFNEITGSYPNNAIALDSSGNSLHANIKNFSKKLRDMTLGSNVSMSLPLVNERPNRNPDLFPLSKEVVTLNSDLLFSASQYDANNPNTITKLIPRHYLLEAQAEEAMSSEDGNVGQGFATGSVDFPGGGTMGSPQIMSLILLMWGKYFDELKVFADHFSKLVHVDYHKEDRVADQFLGFLGQYYGFTLPSFYPMASIAQFNEGENLLVDASYSKHSLRYIQNELWRRILASLREVFQSKGTTYSIKSLIRAIGLNPDNNFRFREFGGIRSKKLLESHRFRSEVSAMLDFSGTLAPQADPEGVNVQGIHPGVPFIMSPFLSGSRIEVGFPNQQGTMVNTPAYAAYGGVEPGIYGIHGISNNENDGLFTSGSFTYEALYKFEPPSRMSGFKHFHTQSLMRLHVTGGDDACDRQGVVFNLLCVSGSEALSTTGSVQLFGCPSIRIAQAPVLHLNLTGVDVMDGNVWHISWGRRCSEELRSETSSSYFLRAGRQNQGELFRYYTTSSRFLGNGHTAVLPPNKWEFTTNTYMYKGGADSIHENESGSFIAIGSQSLPTKNAAGTTNLFKFLNNTILDDFVRESRFSGKVGQLRFWTTALREDETQEHIRNFKSVGVVDPLKNFNFTTSPSGSFARLRLDVSMDQPVTKSDAYGDITLFDSTQNFSSGSRGAPWRHGGPGPDGTRGPKVLFVMSGTGFEKQKRIIKPEEFYYSHIDSKFDERSALNKVRIRSWEQTKNIQEFGGNPAPLAEIKLADEAQDDTRFLIESSFVQALDEDIVKIFGTLEKLNNFLGAPELLFSDNYPDLRNLRDVYFNRLTRRIKIKEFFEFFRWFDDSIGVILERMMPKKTDFLGVQFTIESHMLERTKFRYDFADMYTPPQLNLLKLNTNPSTQQLGFYSDESSSSGDSFDVNLVTEE